jgi:hypothetical protein
LAAIVGTWLLGAQYLKKNMPKKQTEGRYAVRDGSLADRAQDGEIRIDGLKVWFRHLVGKLWFLALIRENHRL